MSRAAAKLSKFMAFAKDLSDLSTCNRASIGALICDVNFTEVLSIGYNGQPRGIDHSRCTGEQGQCGCIHAETNAVIKLHADVSDVMLLCTKSPCLMCAGLIINDGRIDQVIYLQEYRDRSGLMLLEEAGVFTYTLEAKVKRLNA